MYINNKEKKMSRKNCIPIYDSAMLKMCNF